MDKKLTTAVTGELAAEFITMSEQTLRWKEESSMVDILIPCTNFVVLKSLQKLFICEENFLKYFFCENILFGKYVDKFFETKTIFFSKLIFCENSFFKKNCHDNFFTAPSSANDVFPIEVYE